MQPNPGNPVPTTWYPVPKTGSKSTHCTVSANKVRASCDRTLETVLGQRMIYR